MFELQAIASLIVIYLLSLFSCYAALKAQCRGVCNMNYYTYNVSEICIINNVCQNTNKNQLQASIQFLPADSKSREETGKTISTVGYIGKEGMKQTDKEILKVMLEG